MQRTIVALALRIYYSTPAERMLAAGLKQLCDPKGILGAVDYSG